MSDAFHLYEALGYSASAVGAASRGDQATAARKIASARASAAVFAETAPDAAAHALGMITAASSPARYRTEETGCRLRTALNALNMALQAADTGDRASAVTWNAAAAQEAAPLGKLAASFTVISARICTIAQNTEAIR